MLHQLGISSCEKISSYIDHVSIAVKAKNSALDGSCNIDGCPHPFCGQQGVDHCNLDAGRAQMKVVVELIWFNMTLPMSTTF